MNRVVLEQAGFGGPVAVEAHDHAVHRGLPGGLGVPSEGAVGEGHAPAFLKDQPEQPGHLVSLGNGVGGHERESAAAVSAELEGFGVPAGHEVQAGELIDVAPGVAHVRKLRGVAGLVPQEGWVAEDEGLPCRFGQDLFPAQAQRVAVGDVGGDGDGQPLGGLADGRGQAQVGLVVHEEHGGLGDLGRPPVDLDAVEPLDGQLLVQGRVQAHGHALGGRVVLGQVLLSGVRAR